MILAAILLLMLLLAGGLFAGIIIASANDYKNEHDGNE